MSRRGARAGKAEGVVGVGACFSLLFFAHPLKMYLVFGIWHQPLDLCSILL